MEKRHFDVNFVCALYCIILFVQFMVQHKDGYTNKEINFCKLFQYVIVVSLDFLSTILMIKIL